MAATKQQDRERDRGREVLAIIDQMHRERRIPKETLFTGLEAALQQATQRVLSDPDEEEETPVTVTIDRLTGVMSARRGEEQIPPKAFEKIVDGMGRIIAQSVKQMVIQKTREAECETIYSEFNGKKGELITGLVQRVDAGTAIVKINEATEAILPRSEQIPGEMHHVGERVKAVVLEVRKTGHRVKVVLSRCHPDFVRCLFELEIPEIQDHTIEIRAIAREAGYRTKIAVSSIDSKVDCVGACVGVRGSRIKNVIDELGGERIDIVRWNDSLQVMIPNALQPAGIDEMFLYPILGRAIVIVAEDQLSLAIGRRGQNVRLASKLVGWDLEIMTADEFNDSVERAETGFRESAQIPDNVIEVLLEQGFLSYEDVTFLDPAQLAEMASITEEEADELILRCEEQAEQAEQAAKATGGTDREAIRIDRSAKAKAAANALFGPVPEESAPASDARPTLDSLFGPTHAAPATEGEEAVSADDMFGEAPPAPPAEESPEAEDVFGEDEPTPIVAARDDESPLTVDQVFRDPPTSAAADTMREASEEPTEADASEPSSSNDEPVGG